jgi:hypothetical protein
MDNGDALTERRFAPYFLMMGREMTAKNWEEMSDAAQS